MSELSLPQPCQEEPPLGSSSEIRDEKHGGEVRPCRVLIVDDNRPAAKLLGMALNLLGHEVRTAADGHQGIEVAAEFLPHVILMDLGMPRLDGYEAARHIREQPWGEDMLLVALSGWGQEEPKRRSKEAGFDHHLVKPAVTSSLQQLIQESKR